MRERLMIVFVAVFIGLIVTTLVFFLYQQTKSIPGSANDPKPISQIKTDEAENSRFKIDSPQNESLLDRRLIQVKGRTDPTDIIIVSSNQEDVVAHPASDGKFSVSITIDAGANIIFTRSINKSGAEVQDTRIVTYSVDEF